MWNKIFIASAAGALWALQVLHPAPARAYQPIPPCCVAPVPVPTCPVDCFDWNDEYPEGCFRLDSWRERPEGQLEAVR